MSESEYTSSGMDRDKRHQHMNARPPPPPSQQNPKPKKKKKLPPQEAIDKIWSRFSAAKFSKATVVLPQPLADSPKAPPPSSPKPNNLLVSEDFERAAEECRMKVRKLIKECKRVNMRYRDPNFDIDWDLKWEKGDCLNGLAREKFELGGKVFSNLQSSVPKAVKRVHEIFEKPTFLKDKISPADVKQGNVGDCWLMASLTALANMETGIHRICVEYDTSHSTRVFLYSLSLLTDFQRLEFMDLCFTEVRRNLLCVMLENMEGVPLPFECISRESSIKHFRTGLISLDGEWIISIIDDKLYLKSPDWDSPSVQRHLLEQIDREDVEKEYRKTYQTGSQALFFAYCRDQNETWLPLLEKAYAKAHGDYAALAGGWIGYDTSLSPLF